MEMVFHFGIRVLIRVLLRNAMPEEVGLHCHDNIEEIGSMFSKCFVKKY